MLRSWRKWKCILCHTRDVDLFSTLMSSPPFRLNYDGVGGVTRKRCKPFHYSARTVVQCRTGNRRRRTVPATEPSRAAVEIALLCTCATEMRAAGAILSIRCAPSDRAERAQSAGADRCVVTGTSHSLPFRFSAASSSRSPLCGHPKTTDASRGYRCRLDEGCTQDTPSGPAPPAPLAGNETC